MINRKGQTLILFVILIPLLLGLAAFLIDMGLIISKKVHYNEVTRTVLNDVYKDGDFKEEDFKRILIKNEVDIDNLKIIIDDHKIIINNIVEIESIMGNIIGIKKYEIKIRVELRR